MDGGRSIALGQWIEDQCNAADAGDKLFTALPQARSCLFRIELHQIAKSGIISLQMGELFAAHTA